MSSAALADRPVVPSATDALERNVQIAKSFCNAAEETADAIVVTDRNGHIEYVNRAFERTTGYRQEEILGKTPRLLKSGQHGQEFYQGMWATILSGNVFRATIINRKKNGELYHAEQTITPVKDTAGNISHFVSIIRDITERIRTQDQLRRTAEELARSNKELDQFALMVAHDLKAPQRTALTFTQLLQKRCNGKLDAESDEFLGLIASGLTRMGELIDGLLRLARVNSEGDAFEPTDMARLCDAAAAHLRTAIEENGAVVTHDGLPTVMGDATQLIQLFQNLIGNAIKFRRQEPPHIRIAAELTGNECTCSVRDNGIGFDPEQADRIFGIFQRLHTQSEYPGSGIGLAICKKIVERHGGRIWAESKPDEGSAFNFTLPVMETRV